MGEGKKQKKAKKPNQVWKLYEKKGDEIIRKNKTCPKCGEGVYLANHKDRLTCGKCHYMEMRSSGKPNDKKGKEDQPKKEDKPKAEEKKEEKKEAPKEEAKSEEKKE